MARIHRTSIAFGMTAKSNRAEDSTISGAQSAEADAPTRLPTSDFRLLNSFSTEVDF